MKVMQTPGEIVEQSKIYLYIYFAGMVFNLIYNMGSSILRAVGDSKRPLYVLIITCVLNIILDIVLVVFFHMGIAGAAIATVFSPGSECGDRYLDAHEDRRNLPAASAADELRTLIPLG